MLHITSDQKAAIVIRSAKMKNEQGGKKEVQSAVVRAALEEYLKDELAYIRMEKTN